MPRNFGVRRNLFGAELFARYWNDPANDNEREPAWPFVMIGAAMVALFCLALFIR